MRKKIVLIMIIIVISIGIVSYPLKANRNINLMIVAHPDDESIWGGYHLQQGNYYIVCLTNKANIKRNKEFYRILEKTNNDGIILDYPDKIKGIRNNWKGYEKQIEKQLEEIIKSNSYKQIVTHNPNGEYGHIQHIETSRIVSEICVKNKIENKLFYFGKYVKKLEVNDSNNKKLLAHKIDGEKASKKKELILIYSSQVKVMEKLGHMFPYENWIAYDEWKEL